MLVGVTPVQDFLPGALAAILKKAPLTPEKIAFAWRSAVGAAVDKATAIHLHDGVLHVSVKDTSWQREIERSAAVVRARLASLLGTDVVRYVNVTVGSAPSAPAGREASARG